MKPYFKYTGGKTREMKKIVPYIPVDVKRIVEPFCGSCAVSLATEKPALVADIDDDVINLHQIVSNAETYNDLMSLVQATNIDQEKTERQIKHLEKLYYYLRDDEFGTTDKVLKAYRFLVLRQLCFSGMTRFNHKTGKSNVPFGWYPLFKTRLDDTYHQLLSSWEIKLQGFEQTIAEARSGDWVFLDPPYFDRNSSYEVKSNAGTSEEVHTKIRELLYGLTEKNIPWLMVHSDCELYRDIYKDCSITHEAMFYSQNFKGAGIKDARVGHLYITADLDLSKRIILPPMRDQKVKQEVVTKEPKLKKEKVTKAIKELKALGEGKGGWRVHPKNYGKDEMLRSFFNGSWWIAKHDDVFDDVNASLRSKGKKDLFEHPRMFGSGTGLRGGDKFWKVVTT